MKTATQTTRVLQAVKGGTDQHMIPADRIVEHLDDLDGLNGALKELSLLVAAADDLPVPALLDLLRDQYQELAASFWQSLQTQKK